MKIVTAQLNYIIGDFSGNTDKIISAIEQHGDQANLIVFSELCLSGYYPKDLIEREGFLQAQGRALKRVLKISEKASAGIIIGLVTVNPFAGRKFKNSLVVIDDGVIVHEYNKQLLPTYGVFDEDRHFEPGDNQLPCIWRGKRIGFLICEDAWGTESDKRYRRDPVDALAQSDLDLIVSINASPYDIDKMGVRDTLLSTIAVRCSTPVVYVNQVGGIDELVFDGSSAIVNGKGEHIFIGQSFEEETVTTSLSSPAILPESSDRPSGMALISMQLVTGLRDYCHKSGFKQVVVGSSGGIDSAVTLALCVLAMGSENVLAVTMPSKWSSAGSVDDSEVLCSALGVMLINAPIKNTFDQEVASYTEAFGAEPSPLAQENLQARIRGQRLMTYSNSSGAMVVSTGNKSEISVGYCTLYGDMAGGLSLLADLYKGQVYELAHHLNDVVFKQEVIPRDIITKPPSAELAPGQCDSDSLPPYDSLDAFLMLTLEGKRLPLTDFLDAQKIVSETLSEQEQQGILDMLDRNEYKRRQAAPVIRVSKKAFGFDRQIPLTAKTHWA